MENSLPQQEQTQNPTPIPLAPASFHKKWWITGCIILLIGIVFGILLIFQNQTSPIHTVLQSTKQVQTIASTTELLSPTPLPFRELTIPYLREREYKSTLGQLELITEGFSYKSYLASYTSDGFKVNGLLTIPSGQVPSGGWPAIIFVHGYIPPSQYTTQGQYADYVDYLARNEFVVFKIDLRGHADSEGQAGGGYFGADYIADTLNAHAALAASDFVHPQKIGLWGHSMAGNVLLRSVAVKPDIPAVVIWAGAVYSYTDREKYGISDSSFQPSTNPTGVGRRQRLTAEYGQASKGHDFWKQMAATNFLSDLKGAIEIHHAVDDTVVNIGYSRDLMKELDKTSVPHQLHEYQSGGHNITGSSFVEAMESTVAFYKQYLAQ